MFGKPTSTFINYQVDNDDSFGVSLDSSDSEDVHQNEQKEPEKSYPEMKYILIHKSYTENKLRNYRNITTDKYVDCIRDQNFTSSYFEVLSAHGSLKPYFDVEKIPVDQPNLIYDLIGDLRTWFSKETGEELGDYILTHNKHSIGHEGLSYHLIFHERETTQNNISNLLNNFLEAHPEYVKFMDGSVYSNNRLFKSVNQIGVDKKKYCLSDFKDDMHIIVNKEQNDETILQSIIQNTQDCKSIKYNFKSVKRPKSKRISNYTRPNLKQPTIIIHNHIKNDDNNFVPTKESKKVNMDDEIYGKAFALNLKRDQLNDYVKAYINELLEYYDKNKTFDGYKQSKEQILIILKLIE